MPHHKAQAKSLKQDKARQQRNRAARSKASSLTKRALKLAETGDAENAAKVAKDAQAAIDRAANRAAISKNTASRRKAQLAQKISDSGKKETPAS